MIREQFVSRRTATFKGNNGRKTITIHETGNRKKGAGAQAHANLQLRGFTSSWHWQVDDNCAIQSYPHIVQCWHAGDGRGNGNLHSIAIEICVNEDSDYETAVKNAAALTRKIMQEENISSDQVVQHHHWSKKDCPHFLRSGRMGIDWQGFKKLLQGESYVVSIQIGHVGEQVRKLQQNLNYLHYNLVEDGAFGSATRRAVEYFQAMHCLFVDGQVGHQTTAAIKEALLNKAPIQLLKYNSKGRAVGQLQKGLGAINYKLLVDNSFGSQTEQAVRTFQQQEKLMIDGIVGVQTWTTLKQFVFK